jgi:hypothetical protein
MSAPEDRAALGARARTRMADYRADVILDQWEELIADVLR